MKGRQGVNFGCFNQLIQVDPLVDLMGDLTVTCAHGHNRDVFDGPQKGPIGSAGHPGVNRRFGGDRSGGPIGRFNDGLSRIGQRTGSVGSDVNVNCPFMVAL
jgi:hypothetical protein